MIGLPKRMERRIGYIELVIDLMYVYLIGRNDSLLDPQGSFFTATDFAVYLISTLVILQIWATTTMYINRFAKGSVGDYALLFSNLYFMYYIGINTRTDWVGRYAVYHIAWALILLNFLVQFIRLQKRDEYKNEPMRRFLRSRVILFSMQIGALLLAIPWNPSVQRVAAWLPLAIGFAGPAITRKIDTKVPPDFSHLSERVQSLVLIAFGEVVVSIAGYFNDELTTDEIYFSLCAFLVVVGLLLSYGYIYLHMIDHQHCTHSYMYMYLHAMVIISLSCISISFDMTLDPSVNRWTNHLFMVTSMILYYLMLCLITKVAGKLVARIRWLPVSTLLLSAVYAASMLLWYLSEWVSAATSVLYSFLMLICFIAHWRDE